MKSHPLQITPALIYHQVELLVVGSDAPHSTDLDPADLAFTTPPRDRPRLKA